MKIAIGCDEAAYALKEIIREHLLMNQHDLYDFGVSAPSEKVLYPDIAVEVARSVLARRFNRGILLCGTGMGMAISANKVPGIYATVCHDSYSAERSRKSNNAQIMCLGARVIGPELAKQLVDIWIGCDFMGGTSQDKVDRVQYYDMLLRNSKNP